MKAGRSTAHAAAWLISWAPAAAVGGPPTCAVVLKKIEKKMMDAGVRQPELRVVPKNLSAGRKVVASCENGTQHIVHRPQTAASDAATPGDRTSAER